MPAPPESIEAAESPAGLKPDNHARIAWAGAPGAATPLSVLYLHGFTASPMECADIPIRLGRALGANTYLHRLAGHGRADPFAMQGITADAWHRDVDDAYARALALGPRVLLVGSSLGASLALALAGRRAAAGDDSVHGLALWSPGAAPADPALLDWLCLQDAPVTDPQPRPETIQRYWSETVHPDGYRALRSVFAEQRASQSPGDLRQPVFMAYYRADDGREDQTASVPAMLELYARIGSPDKRAQAFDSRAHILASPHKSIAAKAVLEATWRYFSSPAGAAGRGR